MKKTLSLKFQKRIWTQRANPQFPVDYKSFVMKSILFDRIASQLPKRFELFTELSIVPMKRDGQYWLVLQIGTRRALWLDLVQFEDALGHVLDKFTRTEGASE